MVSRFPFETYWNNVACAACTLWSRGSWGEPWFPHCASVASWLTDYCMALCGLLFRSFFTLPYQSLRWYNVIISSCISNCSWTDQLTPTVLVFVLCLFVVCVFCFVWCFCLFCLFLVFGVCFLSCTVTAQWIMYRSNSVLFGFTLSLWLMLPLH